jgi:hypothetical protein
MFCTSKTRADRGKLVPFLESAGQIYPETTLIKFGVHAGYINFNTQNE